MIRNVLTCFIISAILFCQGPSKHFPSSLKVKNAPVVAIAPATPFSHGSRRDHRLALTFDACATGSNSKYDSSIVGTILRTKTPATLFLCGKWAMQHSKETRFLSKQQLFEIGNHSFDHPHPSALSGVRLKEELVTTQNILFTLSRKVPSLFRSPYGDMSDTIVQCAASLGLRTIQYDLASGDPDTSVTTEKLVHYVSTAAKNGSIIVMHMNKRGWHTAEALPEIIERLKKRGFVFVKVSDLLQGH